MHLKICECSVIHRWSNPNVGNTGGIHHSRTLHSHSVYTVKGRLYTLQRNIGGGRAYLTAQLLTFEDFSRKFKGPSKKIGDRIEVTPE